MRRNRKWNAIRDAHGIRREVVLGSFDHGFVKEQEIRLIAELGTRDHLGGCNFTDGGDGNLGARISEEHRRAISAKLKGRKLSDETKRRIAENNGARQDQAREKIRATHLGKPKAYRTGPRQTST